MAEAMGAVVLAAAVVAGLVLGTTLRAIGRGFGSGTFGLAAASAGHADNPTASAKPVAHTVDRKAAVREVWVTTFPRGESFDRSSSRSI
jgi:hypothetical protein